jgi:hypothetical protein
MGFHDNHLCQEFHVEDVRQHVLKRVVVAPNSPYRILYELRREGRLDYKVLNRRQSLYRFIYRKGVFE